MKRLLFVLAAAAALASCPEPKPVPVTEIQLNHTGIVLKDSASAETLKAVVLPAEADSAVRWSVSPEGVVKLTDNGDGSCTVKPAQGVTEGEATVTVFSAAYPSVKQTCIVTVFAGGTLTNTDLIKAVENERTMNWSKDENGCVPLTTANLEEIRRVTYLYISWSKYSATEEDVRLTDLSGIEHFTGLTSLTLYGHQITEMPDLAPLENLRTFGLNSNETSDGVRSLPEGFFSKLPPSVTSLSVSYDGLTDLDVSSLTNLTSLDCSSNELTSLDVSSLTNLTDLDCGSNYGLTDMKFPSGLTDLDCSYCNLTNLNVSSLENLTSLWCQSNNLTSLDVSPLKKLKWLYCFKNQMSALDVSMLSSLSTLGCGQQSDGSSGDRQLTLTVSAGQKTEYWDTGEWKPEETESILNYNWNVVLAEEAAESEGSV